MNGSSSSIVSELGQVGLRRPDVDVRVAVVAEDPEAADRGAGRPTRAAGPPGRTGRCATRPPPAPARMSRSERTLTLRARPGVPALLVQGVDLALERLEVLEALVDAGEPDVGDLVDRAELLHRHGADPRRRAPRSHPTSAARPRSRPRRLRPRRRAPAGGSAPCAGRRRACRGRTPGAIRRA